MNTSEESDPVIQSSEGASVMENDDIYYFDFVVFEVENTRFFEFQKLASCNIRAPTPSSYAECLGALDLATKWNMSGMRERAIISLNRMMKAQTETKSIVESILAAKKYRVDGWVSAGFIKLIGKLEVDMEDLELLGWETAARLLDARFRITRVQLLGEFEERPEETCEECSGDSSLGTKPICKWGCGERGCFRRCAGCAGGAPSKCVYKCGNWSRRDFLNSSAIQTQFVRILASESLAPT
ncbi:hypothetical protein CPB83DRAFT_511014 [Crepidotus variabilis]|uniref:Uncharacterized protein n=1 Tax=Crepidotus variabilis TaxID=179855 RepID=A0A9P6EBB5_9AGAR|nr:hypothetical protein CPB83DRAFT_511014 [Crepidotus variabilis]